jgi:gliding-associated putative ABC transporter substrate-binding component GldG
VNISVDELMRSNKEYSAGPLVVGYLLEGSFSSLYKKRFLPTGIEAGNVLEQSVPTKIIVVADGDVIRNDVNPRTGQPQELGFDPFTQYTFANQDFVMNALAYLTNDNGLISARTKEIKIRPLDKGRIQSEKLNWQVINLLLPIFILIVYGVARYVRRTRKFARF